jgi:oligopeptidase A
LQGYENYANLSLSSKMAPNVEAVLKLIQMLRDNAFPAAKSEFEEMVNFAKAEGFHDQIKNWDFHFWSERLREKAYQYEEEQLRAYFPLAGVLKGLFALAERLFDVTIVAADGKTDVWDKNVRFFEIYDKSNQKYIACFYLDPYSRPAEKNNGAWMAPCIGKSKALGKTPVAYLTCNGSPPVGDMPSLMSFREVETLFHEFGHGLQHMLTRVEHGGAAGINNIEWDAVELPSQFMENWCYDRETLFGFAKHYQTGESLPEELFQSVKAAKNFHAGIALIRQLLFATLDMTLHSSYDPVGTKTPFQLQAELTADYAVIPPLEDDRFLCSFGHIFGGGYAAGYYSYIWAEVMSADAFAAFEEAGLENEAAVSDELHCT